MTAATWRREQLERFATTCAISMKYSSHPGRGSFMAAFFFMSRILAHFHLHASQLASMPIQFTSSISKFISQTAVDKFNKQNPALSIKAVGSFHDRFLILDGAELYHLGASLKDLGRQYCAITKMDAMFIPSIMQRESQEN